MAVNEEKTVHNAHTTGKQNPKTEQLQKIIEKCKNVATSIREGLDDAWEFIQNYGNEYDNPRGGFQKLTPKWKSNW